jgi:hypothetical protein
MARLATPPLDIATAALIISRPSAWERTLNGVCLDRIVSM